MISSLIIILRKIIKSLKKNLQKTGFWKRFDSNLNAIVATKWQWLLFNFQYIAIAIAIAKKPFKSCHF